MIYKINLQDLIRLIFESDKGVEIIDFGYTKFCLKEYFNIEIDDEILKKEIYLYENN